MAPRTNPVSLNIHGRHFEVRWGVRTDALLEHVRRSVQSCECHVEGFTAYKWKKQDTDGAHPPFAPLEEVMRAPDGYQRTREQDP